MWPLFWDPAKSFSKDERPLWPAITEPAMPGSSTPLDLLLDVLHLQLPPELWEDILLRLHPSEIPRFRLVTTAFFPRSYLYAGLTIILVTHSSVEIFFPSSVAPQNCNTNWTCMRRGWRMVLETPRFPSPNAGNSWINTSLGGRTPQVSSTHT